jgi:primosomal replication protein N
MMTNDARQTHQVKTRVAVVKAGFNNKKKTHLTSKLGLKLKVYVFLSGRKKKRSQFASVCF